MAEPAQSAVDEQISQAQQNVLQHSTVLSTAQSAPTLTPPPIPPAPPSLPIETPAKPLGGVKKKGIDIIMSKLSLFTIVLCLMFLGALTFLGGFFIGVWFASPPTLYSPYMTPGYSPYDSYQQQVAVPQQQAYMSSDMPSGYPRQAGLATQAGVSAITLPGVPAPINPLVSATQSAVGEGLGKKLQKELTHIPSPKSFMPHSAAPTSGSPAPSTPPQITATGHTSLHPSSSGNSLLPSHDKGEYAVQLGAYASQENANALVNHLQSLNLTSTVNETKAKNGSTLYYVYSGTYNDYALALKAAARFASYNIPGAIVVKSPVSQKDGK